jgi:hypothetical protein
MAARGRTSTAPRIGDRSADFYPSIFPSLNGGLEYVADTFPALYRNTLEHLRRNFSPGELMLMIDVFNATALTPQLAGQHLVLQVHDGIKLDRLDHKWEIDGKELINKLAELTIFESACLEIWANGFWYGKNQVDADNSDIEAWAAQLL